MTLSFWRYSHLALAVSSFLFIALASVTGIILAFEPVQQKMQPYQSEQFNRLTVAQAIPVLNGKFHDITEVTVDHNKFVILKGTNEKEETVTVYVDPATGKTLGVPAKQKEFFQWVTSLHRSLFLHETGRIFMCVTAFLLFLIATSGTVLILQRQRGLKKFFSTITRDSFLQFYHVYLGRLLLVPIIIISLTGTVLSLGKFGIIPEKKVSGKVDPDSISTSPKRNIVDFPALKSLPLSEVRSIEFPFSEEPEDYFTLKLKDREITVNQVTGETLTVTPYPATMLLTNLSMNLHTGRTSAIWAVVLAFACVNILFFIYSGFAMTLKRRAGIVKNKYKAHQSKFIVLVGSENGSTFQFAKAVHEEILKNGETSFITELNNYQSFPKAEQIVVITSTYGSGNAPANASRFFKQVEKFPQARKVHFSVVGFGSHAYPDFCKFAFEVNNLLAHQPWAVPSLEIHTVNDKSPAEFTLWAEFWSQKAGLAMQLSPEQFAVKPARLQTMVVVDKRSLSPAEPYFLLTLQSRRRVKFTSGDLLAIYPGNDHRERQYSIGKVNGKVRLSVKLHEKGLGSGFLHSLQTGETIAARIIRNKHFHFPKKAASVVMISNGTGIAPFLGMIDQNKDQLPVRLYCGFRTFGSFGLYEEQLQSNLNAGQLNALHVAYSREGEKQYVKDLLVRDADFIAATLSGNGVIMLCGSLSMQNTVVELLERICTEKNGRPISYYQSHGQVLMDCY